METVPMPRARYKPPYAWAPPTVRHLFRTAGFGACPHGVIGRRFGDIAWASSCSNACREGSEPSTSTLFALGHWRECGGAMPPFGEAWQTTVRTMRAEPIGEHVVARAIPGELFDLARALKVQAWGVMTVRGSDVDDVHVAVGFVLGMPICLVAPESKQHHRLAKAGTLRKSGPTYAVSES